MDEAHLGAYFREKGLYVEQIAAWRGRPLLQANTDSDAQAKAQHVQTMEARQQIKRLKRKLWRNDRRRTVTHPKNSPTTRRWTTTTSRLTPAYLQAGRLHDRHREIINQISIARRSTLTVRSHPAGSSHEACQTPAR